MNVFIDTEFSSLGSDPRLISIALVAENGEELYIEFQSGWKLEQCSSWVRSNVLPLLGDGEKLDRPAAAVRIHNWLSQFPSLGKIIVDSSWDVELINILFNETGVGATKYPIETIKLKNRAEIEIIENLRRKYVLEKQCLKHHALHDARSLRFAFQKLNLNL